MRRKIVRFTVSKTENIDDCLPYASGWPSLVEWEETKEVLRARGPDHARDVDIVISALRRFTDDSIRVEAPEFGIRHEPSTFPSARVDLLDEPKKPRRPEGFPLPVELIPDYRPTVIVAYHNSQNVRPNWWARYVTADKFIRPGAVLDVLEMLGERMRDTATAKGWVRSMEGHRHAARLKTEDGLRYLLEQLRACIDTDAYELAPGIDPKTGIVDAYLIVED